MKFVRERMDTIRGKAHLDMVYLETTAHCTNRCYMCPNRISTVNRGVLSDENFKKAIDELSAHDYTGELHLYGQGEPLLDKKIFDKIDYAHKRLPNAKIQLISNFVVLNDERIKKLLDAPISRFTNSIYALDGESYQKICGRDNFKRAITNLIKFSKAWAQKQPYEFTVFLIDCEYNRHDSDFVNYFLHKIPCSRYSRNPVASLRGILERKRNPWFFGRCLYREIHIKANGDMSPCATDADAELFLGNISADNVMDVLNSKRAQKIRNDIFYGKNREQYSTFCDVCDFAINSKISYLCRPSVAWRRAIWHRIQSLSGIRSQGSNTYNNSKEISKKLIEFEDLFHGNEDDWFDIISGLRADFYASEKKEVDYELQ